MYDPNAYNIIADAYSCFRRKHQYHEEPIIVNTAPEPKPEPKPEPTPEPAPELKGGAHVKDAIDNLTSKFSYIDDVFETSGAKFKLHDDFDTSQEF